MRSHGIKKIHFFLSEKCVTLCMLKNVSKYVINIYRKLVYFLDVFLSLTSHINHDGHGEERRALNRNGSPECARILHLATGRLKIWRVCADFIRGLHK